MMAQELIRFVTLLEEHMSVGPFEDFKPFFELVGSMAEGTRVGLANELDLALKFKSWMDEVPFAVSRDPFSLKKAETAPEFMNDFFSGNLFQFHKFMHFLLKAIESAITLIYQRPDPPKLKRVTTNEDWNKGRTPCQGKCKRDLKMNNFEQCEHCIVTVSQTKSGVALQLIFDGKKGRYIYCSIDLIPVFNIKPILTMQLTRLIVTPMLSDDPPLTWLNFLFKYAKDYKVIQELAKSGSGQISFVGLKTMSIFEGRNHHVKPAQQFSSHRFSSDGMKEIYGCIKFLKKALQLDLSSYWVKRVLMKSKYQSILDSFTGESSDRNDLALISILMQPEFKAKLEHIIDFEESKKRGYVYVPPENYCKNMTSTDAFTWPEIYYI